MDFAQKVRKHFGVIAVALTALYNIALAGPEPGLKFVENKNQWPGQVQFTSSVRGGTVFLMNDRFRFRFIKAGSGIGRGHHYDKSEIADNEDGSQSKSKTTFTHTFDVSFIGANHAALVKGQQQLKTIYNYFIGNDPSKWSKHLRSFSEVRYENIYQGVDLLVYSKDDNMKYEWILQPQVDPSQIQLKYSGLDQIDLQDGNLHIKTSVNEIWEYQPFAYQWVDGKKHSIACEYVLMNNTVTYRFPNGYDNCKVLVIDPILVFSGYSGSTLDNWGNTATYDDHGNTYSGGMVNNPDHELGFPTTAGAYQTESVGGDWDVGILKYDSSGANILYATYVGGSRVETPQSLVVNNNGELLILGATSSTDFPRTNSTTFRGGTDIDPLGGVYYENGTDIFIAKLSEQGDAFLAGTYLGGSQNDGVNFISGYIDTENDNVESPLARNYGDQLRGDIIVDENDTVYVASITMSHDFTGKINNFGGGDHDAVIVKLLPDLSSVKWAKLLGGSNSDAAYSIKLNSDLIYLAGGTNSSNFPGVNGLNKTLQGNIDGWLASLSKTTGAIVNATYLGTSEYDQAYFIDLNETGEVYAYGQTKGKYPVKHPSPDNGGFHVDAFAGQFIHKLTSDLKTTVFSTTIGSPGTSTAINPNISPTAFLVNECNTLYISGWGGRVNAPVLKFKDGTVLTYNYVGGNTKLMPISANGYQKKTIGDDFYLAVFSADKMNFLYGTYLGGSKSPTHVDGGTSRFDKKGIVYHAVCAGCGGFSDFPAVNVPTSRSQNNSDNCNNAAFKFDLSILRARLQTNSIQLDMPGYNRICIPDPLVIQNKSFGGEQFRWTFRYNNQVDSDTTFIKPDTTAIIHYFKKPGQYTIFLTALDSKTCVGKDSVLTVVNVYERQTTIQDDDELCPGDIYSIKAHGKAFYDWTTKNGSYEAHDTLTTHIVTPLDTTMYYVTITEDGGCIRKDSVQLNVIPDPGPNFKISKIHDCFSRPKVEFTNLTKLNSTDEIIFDFGDGQTSDADKIVHDYASDNIYHTKLTISRHICVFEKLQDVKVYTLKAPNVFTPGNHDDKNEAFTIQYGDAGKTPGDYGLQVSLFVYNRWGKLVYESNDYHNDWHGEGLAPGVYYYEAKIDTETLCKDWVHLIK